MAAAPAPARPTARELAADIRRRHRGLIRELWIEVGEAGAVLHGRAYNFYGKQVALHEVRRRAGVTVVANRIQVDR